MCFFVQTNHTRKELLFLMFKEINLRNHSSLHKLFYSLANSEPLSVVIVLKISFQCSPYCLRRLLKAFITLAAVLSGILIIRNSRLMRSDKVSSTSSSLVLWPKTRSHSQCSNTSRLLTFYQTGPNGLFIFYQVFNLILQSVNLVIYKKPANLIASFFQNYY